MDRIKFLAQPDVRGFVDWLCLNLAHLNIHLRFSPSRFVKGGINRQVVGIEGFMPSIAGKVAGVITRRDGR